MTDAISNVQATYEPLEDRILLNITTQEHAVYSAWITRRYLKLLLPALQGNHPRTLKPLLSEEALGFLHSNSVEIDPRSPIFEPYEINEETLFPLGEDPILLTKIAFKKLGSDQPLMEMNPDSGAGFEIPFEASVLKLLANILQQALPRADWDLEMNQTFNLPEPSSLH